MTGTAKPMCKVIYKITYPNRKLFIGKALADDITDFGHADPKRIAKDLTRKQRRDFMIRKEILWESDTATDEEIANLEAAYIRTLGANDPKWATTSSRRSRLTRGIGVQRASRVCRCSIGNSVDEFA